MAIKIKQYFQCQQCAAVFNKWSGQCIDCGSWNAIQEVASQDASIQKTFKGYSGKHSCAIKTLSDIQPENIARLSTGFSELDRVLGGGLVSDAIVMIGGDPGIGKSTILLQVLAKLTPNIPTLYVTGEESLQQVALRAQRLTLQAGNLKLLAETRVEIILDMALRQKPKFMVIDSIQTMHSVEIAAAPGSVSQLRECTAKLVQFSKSHGIAIFLIGHVTKDGALAGPRVLEHMVDTVLYFEGGRDTRYRVIRAIKNRFGAVNELGIFAMTEQGLKAVSNPSAIFLSGANNTVSGSVIMAAWEGSRPLLVELQALVDQSHLGNPRRVVVGVDTNRLTIALAVLHQKLGIATYDQDVFINIVGGVRIMETSADLALICAVLSSLKKKPLPRDLIIFGEVGLVGEVRPVEGGLARLKEAKKHGFKRALIPKANLQGQTELPDMDLFSLSSLDELLTLFDELSTHK